MFQAAVPSHGCAGSPHEKLPEVAAAQSPFDLLYFAYGYQYDLISWT